jgi:hypothetical protein
VGSIIIIIIIIYLVFQRSTRVDIELVNDKAAVVVGSKTPFPYAPACFEERRIETCVIAVLGTKSSCTCEVHA